MSAADACDVATGEVALSVAHAAMTAPAPAMKRIRSGLGIEYLQKLDCACSDHAQLLLVGETLEPADTLHRGFPPPLPRPAGQPGGQARPQFRESLPHSFLHRLDGDLERARDLDVPEPLLAAQSKDFAAVVGE